MSLPQHLTHELLHIRDEQDVQQMLLDQEECIQTYKTAQQKLNAFNEFSKARYEDVHKHFQAHTKLLREMKIDLDSIFIKLRRIKAQLELRYPDEANAAYQQTPPLALVDDT